VFIQDFVNRLLPLYRVKTFENIAHRRDEIFTTLTLNIDFSPGQRRS
jgi:hypothetical protein